MFISERFHESNIPMSALKKQIHHTNNFMNHLQMKKEKLFTHDLFSLYTQYTQSIMWNTCAFPIFYPCQPGLMLYTEEINAKNNKVLPNGLIVNSRRVTIQYTRNIGIYIH